MKKLMSMVETVPEHPHAKFLQQIPTLGMFVRCDEEGNVLEEPFNYKKWIKKALNTPYELDLNKYELYEQAEQRVIFEGWLIQYKDNLQTVISDQNMDNIYFFNDGAIIYNNKLIKTIEDLVPYNLIMK